MCRAPADFVKGQSLLVRNLIVALAVVTSLPVWAGASEPYSAKRFDQLASQGRPVLVAVHADWCPTCRPQKPIVSELLRRPDFKDLTELVMDFDHDRAALKRLHVGQQSTLIAFDAGKENERSVCVFRRT
jgi:thioredoxin 1